MSPATRRSPRATTLLLLLALVLGTTAVAGTAYGASLTAAQVRKIAAKVVAKKAPGLTVKRAADADNADDSAKLDGRSSSVYLDRTVFEELAGPTALGASGEFQILNPTALTVPQGVDYVHMSGSATMIGGSINFGMWIEMDGVCVNSGNDFTFRQLGNTSDNQESVTVDRTIAVTPGVHNFRMCVQVGGVTNAGARSLSVETVATNGNGN